MFSGHLCAPRTGFLLLEELSAPDANNFTYAARYQLDDTGDKLVAMLAEAENTRGGDRKFDEQWTIGSWTIFRASGLMLNK